MTVFYKCTAYKTLTRLIDKVVAVFNDWVWGDLLDGCNCCLEISGIASITGLVLESLVATKAIASCFESSNRIDTCRRCSFVSAKAFLSTRFRRSASSASAAASLILEDKCCLRFEFVGIVRRCRWCWVTSVSIPLEEIRVRAATSKSNTLIEEMMMIATVVPAHTQKRGLTKMVSKRDI